MHISVLNIHLTSNLLVVHHIIHLHLANITIFWNVSFKTYVRDELKLNPSNSSLKISQSGLRLSQNKRNARLLPGVVNHYAKEKILHFSMEILRTHEYDISLVRGG